MPAQSLSPEPRSRGNPTNLMAEEIRPFAGPADENRPIIPPPSAVASTRAPELSGASPREELSRLLNRFFDVKAS